MRAAGPWRPDGVLKPGRVLGASQFRRASPSPLSPEVQLEKFHEPGIFNYSVLLLSEDKSTLYVGAREAVFALSALNVSEKQHEVWHGLHSSAVWATDLLGFSP